jgi:hypothetical protein
MTIAFRSVPGPLSPAEEDAALEIPHGAGDRVVEDRHGTPEPGCRAALAPGVVRIGEMKMLSPALKTPLIGIPSCDQAVPSAAAAYP